MGSANTSPVLFKRWKYFFNKQSTLSTRFSPKPSPPSLTSKCSEKQWLVWPLSASLPSMLTQSSKNVTELMLMNTLTLPHLLMGMQNLLPLTVPQLPPMMPQLLHMVNQLHHTESQHPAMVLPKPTCLTSPQSSLVS